MSNFKKRILFISPFFYPEPISTGKYNTDLVKGLAKRGCDVTVICSHPFYPEWKVKRTKVGLDNIKIIRGGANIWYSTKPFFRRIVLETWFSFYVLAKVLKHRKDNDSIIFVFPPSFAAYIILPFIRNLNKIGIVHDLQEIHSKQKGLKNMFVNKIIRFVERNSYRKFDKLIFLSEEMRFFAQKYYCLEPSKLKVQYPFSNINTSFITHDLSAIFVKGKKHVVYSGALGKKQSPNRLYSFFEYASTKIPETHFHFFSKGLYFEKLKNNNKNKLIKFHNLVKEENLSELYLKSTVQIIPQEEGTSLGSLPSKLPNLVASGCEVLLITDKNSELERLFKKNNLGSVATLWNNEELCTKLKESLSKNPNEKERNNEIIKRLFSIDSLIEQIIKS